MKRNQKTVKKMASGVKVAFIFTLLVLRKGLFSPNPKNTVTRKPATKKPLVLLPMLVFSFKMIWQKLLKPLQRKRSLKLVRPKPKIKTWNKIKQDFKTLYDDLWEDFLHETAKTRPNLDKGTHDGNQHFLEDNVT